jgi:hypothetical protein
MGPGLCNAPPTFTRLMTHVLDPFIHLFVIVYLDVIFIYSNSPEEYLAHLRKVLKKLRENKLFIKMVKCLWAKIETEYLGFILGVAIFVHRMRNWQGLNIGLFRKHKNRFSHLLLFVPSIANLFTTLHTTRLR